MNTISNTQEAHLAVTQGASQLIQDITTMGNVPFDNRQLNHAQLFDLSMHQIGRRRLGEIKKEYTLHHYPDIQHVLSLKTSNYRWNMRIALCEEIPELLECRVYGLISARFPRFLYIGCPRKNSIIDRLATLWHHQNKDVSNMVQLASTLDTKIFFPKGEEEENILKYNSRQCGLNIRQQG